MHCNNNNNNNNNNNAHKAVLCGAQCESVVHALWECSAYSYIRGTFVEKLQEFLDMQSLTSLIV